jgi:hypothetical protein
MNYAAMDSGEYDKQLEIISLVSERLYKTMIRLCEIKARIEYVSSKELTGKKEHVYDLSMNPEDGAPLFVANGFITKNSGGDFWRWTDTIDQTSQYKLRAMGVSESFISGESTYAAMEISLSVFLENLRSDRDYVTQEIFNGHLLPLIAHTNDLVRDPRHKELGYAGRTVSQSRGRLTGNIDFDISDPAKYKLPKLTWNKSLRPEADAEYLQTLDTLVEKGVPISVAMYASAGGVSIDEILNHQEKDVELMKRIQGYNKALEAVGGGAMELDEEDDYALSSVDSTRAVLEYELGRAKTEARSKPKSLLTRLDSIAEETSEVFQGKKHHVPSARAARERNKQKDTAKKVMSNLATNDQDWRNARRLARSFISSHS